MSAETLEDTAQVPVSGAANPRWLQMPGMATEDELRRLRSLSARELAPLPT